MLVPESLYESIKHLSGKSEEEIKKSFDNLPAIDKLESGIEIGSLYLVKKAIEEGANISVTDDYAIKMACSKGYLDIVKYIFEIGDYFYIKRPILGAKDAFIKNVHQNYNLQRCLEYAIEGNHIKVVQFLLDKKIEITDNALQLTKNKPSINILLKHYKQMNENIY